MRPCCTCTEDSANVRCARVRMLVRLLPNKLAAIATGNNFHRVQNIALQHPMKPMSARLASLRFNPHRLVLFGSCWYWLVPIVTRAGNHCRDLRLARELQHPGCQDKGCTSVNDSRARNVNPMWHGDASLFVTANKVVSAARMLRA